MKVTHVKKGEAPDTADRIFIDRRKTGEFIWGGAIDVGGTAAFGASPDEFPTAEAAEADALAWAQSRGATEVMIEIDDG